MRSSINNSFHAPNSDESDSESESTPSRGYISGGQRSSLLGTSVQTPGQRNILDHTPLFRPARKDKDVTGSRDLASGTEGSRRWTLGGSGKRNAEAGSSRMGLARLPNPIPHIRTVRRPPRRSLPSSHTDQPVSRPEKRRRTMMAMAMTNTAGLNNAEAIVVSDCEDDANDDDDIVFIPNPPVSTTPRQPRVAHGNAAIPDTGAEATMGRMEPGPDRLTRPEGPIQPTVPASATAPAPQPATTVNALTRTPSAIDASQGSAIIPSASPIVISTAGPSRTISISHRPPIASTSTTSNRPPRKSYRVIPTDEVIVDFTVARRSHVDLRTPSPTSPPPASQGSRNIIVIDDSDGEAEDEDQRAMDRHIRQLEERTRLAAQKKAQAKAKIVGDQEGANREGEAQELTPSNNSRELPGQGANANQASTGGLPDEGDPLEQAGSRVSPGPDERIRIVTDSSASTATAIVTASASETTEGTRIVTAREVVEKRLTEITPQSDNSLPTAQAASTQPSTSATAPMEEPDVTYSLPHTESMSASSEPSAALSSAKIALKAISSDRPSPLSTRLFPGSDPAQDPMQRLDRMARFLDTLNKSKTKRSEAEVVAIEVAVPMQAPPTPPEMQDHQPESVHKAAAARPACPVTEDADIPQRPIEQSDLLRKHGLPCPISKGRINNKYTRFSTAIVPGTLKDLMWELDLLYYGSVRGRQDMRWQEEDKIWDNLRNLSDKRRFLQCCWNRWTTEKGPIRADRPAYYLRGWLDKYGEIMRFGGLDLEIRDHLATLFETNIIGLQTFSNACEYWERHMRHYRKIRECPEILDEEHSDTEPFVDRGVITLKEFELGGRHYEEVVERRRAKEEGRQLVLPKEKYVLE